MEKMIGIDRLLKMLPKGYEDACYSTRAIVRKRAIKSPAILMTLVLFHLLSGCSLVEVTQIAKVKNLAEISNVAFMKRFKKCNEWFKWILEALRTTTKGVIHYNIPERLAKHRILAVDASDVSEKGMSGRIFRLHFALDICNMQSALYKITSNKVGEHLRNFDFSKGDLVIADRIYSSTSGIVHCLDKECDYIVRMRANSFRPLDAEGKKLDLLSFMEGKGAGELFAFVKHKNGEKVEKLIPVRICFQKKDQNALDATRKKMKRKESKKQITISASTYKFNEYIVLVTSLDESITIGEIIELYRYRWQVELYFKRLKSILGYGELPKKSEESIFAWLNGKLMIALLIESMIGEADFSPCDEYGAESMAGNENCETAPAMQHN